MTTVDWLIIGGGIHGVHLAARLLGDAKVDPEQLRIVDPGAQLLTRWQACTATTGMTYLRSPSVHHLDLNPQSLRYFANALGGDEAALFTPPYRRPALSLFNAHCAQVIETFGLADRHIQGRVARCTIEADGVHVQLSGGDTLLAQHVVLAIGASDQPLWPDWAVKDSARISHVFEPGFDGWPADEETVVVVGGGISGGQVALRLLAAGHQVHLVSRHALREQQFDSDPGWLGPKFMIGFSQEPDVERRRAMIAEARHRGSVPPELRRVLLEAIQRGQLHWHEARVEQLNAQPDHVTMRLSTGADVRADSVLLATGFEIRRPGGALVDQLVESAALACAQCGYPIVDTALRWHPRVFVSGPLAELELGPASRNIAGARRAGDRLVEAALATPRPPPARRSA